MDNEGDKKIVKSPYYSLEKLSEDSSFVKRGLRDLSIWPKIDELYKKLRKKYFDNLIDECIQICKEVLNTEPNHIGTLLFYGKCLQSKGSYEEAIIYLTRVIDEDRDTSSAFIIHLACSTRAVCYYKIGNYEKANEDLKISRLFSPEFDESFKKHREFLKEKLDSVQFLIMQRNKINRNENSEEFDNFIKQEDEIMKIIEIEEQKFMTIYGENLKQWEEWVKVNPK